jgi:hypothetical protein
LFNTPEKQNTTMYLTNSISFLAFLLAGCAVIFGLNWEVTADTLWAGVWLSIGSALGAFVLVTAFQFSCWTMRIQPGCLAEILAIYGSSAASLSLLAWQFPSEIYVFDVWIASLGVTTITVLLGLLASHKVFNQHWFPQRKKASQIS